MAIHPIKIFYCYAHEDDALREQLARHLSPLQRLGDITGWFNRDIQAGAEWERESMEQLDSANIILLLVSADFMASDYCYTIEMKHAFERHQAGTAHVIPILLRPVAWKDTPLRELSPLPSNGMPVTQWANPDAAWLNIVQVISDLVRRLLPKQLLSILDTDILYTEQGPLSGQIIGGKYLLGELIGEGGFSQVYKAQHLQIKRQQAVKVLLERYFRKSEFRDRFLREAQTVASLDHPHIIHLDDFWVEASQAYLVMPFMSRGTLQDILQKQQGFLEHDQIVFYLEQICAALEYAHKHGVVHLDLKPLNFLVSEDDRLLLSDFGLAHLMKMGAVEGGSSLRVGTSHYMAPEHIKGSPERRSDLFSLGVILYQMLIGRLLFDGLPHETILIKNIMEWPAAPRLLRPELPKTVEDMLAKALAKQPEHRHQTANEFLVAFKKALKQANRANVTAVGTRLFTYSGHSDRVNSIAWSPDSNCIASISNDNTLQVWSSQLGRQIFVCNYELYDTHRVTYSPDGTRIATRGSGSVRVWDAVTGRSIADFGRSHSPARKLAWSPDGTRIATISLMGQLDIWNTTTGQNLTPLSNAQFDDLMEYSCIAWSSDGNFIAYGRAHIGWGDNLLNIVDATRGRTLFTLPCNPFDVAWSPDGDRLACVASERSEYWPNHLVAGIWDVKTRSRVVVWDKSLSFNGKGRDPSPITIAWSPDSSKIVLAANKVFIWECYYRANPFYLC